MTAASHFDSLPGGWLGARRTLVLVGHLPVMSGLWISQYADREARENGPACLVRVASDSVQLELFRAGSRRPAIRPQASYAEALGAVAPVVSQWLIVAPAGDSIEIPRGTDDIVVLTGADQAAVVAAYKLVKSAHEVAERLGGARPAISVAVLGADPAECANVAARIGEAAGTSLGIQIPVRGGLQRVGPAESSFRGTFDEQGASLERVCEVISRAISGSSTLSATVQPEAEPERAVPFRAPLDAHSDDARGLPGAEPDGPLRFEPRSDRRPPVARTAPEPIPFRREPPPRGGRGTAPVRTPPSRVAPPPARSAPDAIAATSAHAPIDEARLRATIESASETLREARPEQPRPEQPRPEQPRPTRGAYHASAVSGPSVLPPLARAVESALPDSLVPFVAGLTRIDHFAPRCERVEFAVDASGVLHLLCRVEDLRMLERTRTWLRENGSLFRRAFPELANTSEPVVEIFVREIADLSPIEGANLHLMRQLEFGGRRFYDLQTLTA